VTTLVEDQTTLLLAFKMISYISSETRSPVVHLWAIARIFRVHYTHDLSLALEGEAFEAGLADNTTRPPRMALRYRIEWREPKRFGQLMKQWNRKVQYWWLVKGTVTEKLGLESQQFIRRQSMDGISILDRIHRDLADDPDRFTFDRDQWKVQAMNRMAAKHKFDYYRKNYDVSAALLIVV
jgi:hypothetical protein